MSFQDLKQRVKINDVAEYLGYTFNPSAGKRYLEYRLMNGNSKVDEIVIYTNSYSQTFFSRSGIGDKGDVVNFILNRLHMFSYYEGEEYEAVAFIMAKIGGMEAKKISRNYVVPSDSNRDFDKDNYEESLNRKIIYAFLCQVRGINSKIVTSFIERGAVKTLRQKDKKFVNVAFPYATFSEPKKVQNYELRNQSYKGFCAGGNKASACWIASFADREEVKKVYIGESAIDMVSLYQLLPSAERMSAAFISIGGYLSAGQIDGLRDYFPNAQIYLAFDNDLQGQMYDVMATYFLTKGIVAKVYKSGDDIVIKTDIDTISIPQSKFNSSDILAQIGEDSIHIIKAGKGCKDFNEMLLL